MARRLATQLDAILEDAAMLAENTDLHLHGPRTRPSFTKGPIEAMLSNIIWTRPPSRSWIGPAGCPDRGTCRMSVPVNVLKSSPPRCPRSR